MAARVLILDPFPEVQDLLRHLVALAGHEPVVVAEGAEADVVLVEPQDPLARETAIRLRAEQPRLPVICVTILPRAEASEGLEPVAYVQKPFTRRELDTALEKALALVQHQ